MRAGFGSGESRRDISAAQPLRRRNELHAASIGARDVTETPCACATRCSNAYRTTHRRRASRSPCLGSASRRCHPASSRLLRVMHEREMILRHADRQRVADSRDRACRPTTARVRIAQNGNPVSMVLVGCIAADWRVRPPGRRIVRGRWRRPAIRANQLETADVGGFVVSRRDADRQSVDHVHHLFALDAAITKARLTCVNSASFDVPYFGDLRCWRQSKPQGACTFTRVPVRALAATSRADNATAYDRARNANAAAWYVRQRPPKMGARRLPPAQRLPLVVCDSLHGTNDRDAPTESTIQSKETSCRSRWTASLPS